jgi:hypothetical protein
MITKPIIHMNGTHPKDLLAAYRTALTAIEEATVALGACSPNGRDYYSLHAATAEHSERMNALGSIADQLFDLAQHIVATCPASGPLAL